MACTTSDFYADIQASRGGYVVKDYSEQVAQRSRDQQLSKATGEGSRGGHIIGHTRGGHAIYAEAAAGSRHYAKMTPADHHEAGQEHDLLSLWHRNAAKSASSDATQASAPALKHFHGGLASFHADRAAAHDLAAKGHASAGGAHSREMAASHVLGVTSGGARVYNANHLKAKDIHRAAMTPSGYLSPEDGAIKAAYQYPHFTANDHKEAADMHSRRSSQYGDVHSVNASAHRLMYEGIKGLPDSGGVHHDELDAFPHAKTPIPQVASAAKDPSGSAGKMKGLAGRSVLATSPSGKKLFAGGQTKSPVSSHPVLNDEHFLADIEGDNEDIIPPNDHISGATSRPHVMKLAQQHFPDYSAADHLTAAKAHHGRMWKLLDADADSEYPTDLSDVASQHHSAAQFHLMAGHYLQGDKGG